MVDFPNAAYDFGLFRSFFDISMGSKRRRTWEEELDSLAESEIYARYLLTAKNGYPLWEPRLEKRLPESYGQGGVRIGDVVTLSEAGGVHLLFNACLPADHPVNSGRVPPDFTPFLDLDDRHRAIYPNQYPIDSYVPSNHTHFTQTRITYNIGPSHTPDTSGFSFSSMSSKGALLILPEGGKREDHLEHDKFIAYIAKWAKSWYLFIGHLGLAVQNDAIYFITGHDKARTWGVASFNNGQQNGVKSVVLEFVRKPPTADETRLQRFGLPGGYFFPRIDYASARSGEGDDVLDIQSGCVFLRGFKIAIRGPELNSDREFTRPSVYHPSDTINKWILSNNVDVDVAITHDNDWASLIHDDDLEIPDNRELIHRINTSKNLELVKHHLDGHTHAYFEKPAPHNITPSANIRNETKTSIYDILVSGPVILFAILISILLYCYRVQ